MDRRDQFEKSIVISFDVDTESGKQVQKIINKLKEQGKLDVELPKEKDVSSFSKSLSGAMDILGDKAMTLATSFASFLAEEIKKYVVAGWNEIGTMVSYSQLTDSSIRDIKFTYGLDSAQAYGFSEALRILGINEDDLFYMDETQKNEFYSAFNKYTEKYNKLADSGFFKEYQEFQYEMEEFKQDITTEFLEFFISNKDVIMKGFDAIIKLSDFVLDGLGNFLNPMSLRTESERANAISQIMTTSNNVSNVSNVKNANTLNLKIDNAQLLQKVLDMYMNSTAAMGG